MTAWLLGWLWQGLALTAGVALALRLARPLGAATRYALWWVALAAVVLLPAAGALARQGPAARAPSGLAAVAAPAETILPVALPAPPDWAVAIVIGAWLGFVLLGLLQVVRAIAHVRALKRTATPLPAERARRLRLWTAAQAGGGRAVELCESDALAVPAALGLGRAMVVVPRAIVERLKDDDLDQIVLHEYAHLSRRDDWTRLAQALVSAVVGFHPAVLWIDRRLDLEREAACDDFVVRRTGAPRRYAVCLTHAAELAYDADADAGAGRALAPGAAGSTRDLAARVVRLLDGRARARRLGLSMSSLTAGVMAVGAAVTLCAHAAPLVAVAAPVAIDLPTPPPAAVPARVAPMPAGNVDVPVPASPPSVERRMPEPTPAPPAVGRAWHAAVQLPAASAWWSEPTDVPAPALDSVPLTAHVQAPAVASGPAGGALRTVRADRNPWLAVGDAGSAVGAGVKKASVATAGFFTHVGRSIAGVF